nr:hypothetical protein [Amylibacter sp.]
MDLTAQLGQQGRTDRAGVENRGIQKCGSGGFAVFLITLPYGSGTAATVQGGVFYVALGLVSTALENGSRDDPFSSAFVNSVTIAKAGKAHLWR